MSDETETLVELTDSQKGRIEDIREECTEDGQVPKPTVEQTITSLLDTWDAVNNGLYTRRFTPNKDLRKLVWEFDELKLEDGMRRPAREAYSECAKKLETVIDDE